MPYLVYTEKIFENIMFKDWIFLTFNTIRNSEYRQIELAQHSCMKISKPVNEIFMDYQRQQEK